METSYTITKHTTMKWCWYFLTSPLVVRLEWACKEHKGTLTDANKSASARIHRCSTSPSGVFQRVSNPRNGWVLYKWFIQGHRISAEVGERYGISCRHLVLGGGYKLQRISLRTLDPPSYNNRFTANGCLRNVGDSEMVQQFSPSWPTPNKPWDTGQSKENP
jgi:hypothetical protein